jgi:hypothetical protein
MMAKKRGGRGVSANRTNQTELFCCVQKERERERERTAVPNHRPMRNVNA